MMQHGILHGELWEMSDRLLVGRTIIMTGHFELPPEEVDIPFSILDTDLYKVSDTR
jgi:hypothetical protein